MKRSTSMAKTIAGVAAMLAIASAGRAVPPPVPQNDPHMVANCRAPSYASDQLVCGDPRLLALDRQLAALLPVPDLPAFAVEDQQAWFSRSRACAMQADHPACLGAAYRERIATIHAARSLQRDAPAWRSIRCGRKDGAMAELGGTLVAVRIGETGRLMSIAREAGSWQPFAWMELKGRKIIVHAPGDKPLKCVGVS